MPRQTLLCCSAVKNSLLPENRRQIDRVPGIETDVYLSAAALLLPQRSKITLIRLLENDVQVTVTGARALV